jgi:hypothetical protein
MGRLYDGTSSPLSDAPRINRAPAPMTRRLAMPKFMDVHEGFFGVTQEQVAAAHDADVAIQDSEGVRFERWWCDPTSGKVFCLSEGPTREAVAKIHARAGHPTESIYELPLSGE